MIAENKTAPVKSQLKTFGCISSYFPDPWNKELNSHNNFPLFFSLDLRVFSGL